MYIFIYVYKYVYVHVIIYVHIPKEREGDTKYSIDDEFHNQNDVQRQEQIAFLT